MNKNMSTKNKFPLLSIHKLSAAYGNGFTVSDVSVELYIGEFCALLGLNGSGKTTLLKAICGLITVQQGSIKHGNTDITKLGEKRRAQYISYIPQRHSKLIGVSVFDAVLMGQNANMGVFDSPSPRNKAAAMQALKKMGIADLAQEDFSKLSEGQKQLVILSRTLAQNAPVMLMDEPDSALDFPNKHSILAKIRDLIRHENKTGLITLHDPNLALAYCDRVITLKDGKTVSDVRPGDAGVSDVRDCLSEIYPGIDVKETEEGEIYCSIKAINHRCV